ncbi:MAG TPA: Clp protease N-terminal domain-containing protein, partial [Spongiibacteraceae bacterium]|nr:Clp protease N-terminal domain-containing protein [Spongiibacteraceae bacterium]
MRADRFTNQLQLALSDAQSLALGRDHNFMESAHLLSVMLDQKGGAARGLLAQAGANVPALTQAVHAHLESLPRVEGTGADIHMAQEFGRLLNMADKLAQKQGDGFISTETVLLASMGTDS